MTQGVSHQHQQQQSYDTYSQAGPALSQQNLPTIKNLINPPQNDGSTQSRPDMGQGEPEDASATRASEATQQLPQAQPTPQPTQIRQTKGKYSLLDFDILRTLGTGSFGRVHLVQSKHNQRFYAVKVLKKQQVVKMKQVEHTNDERRMLQEVKHPFLITLWGTFQDSKNLYMVMDFVEGGELFSLLRKSQVSGLDSRRQANANNAGVAVPQPCRQVLCRRGHPGTRIPARERYHLQGSQARELAPRSAWASQDHRFWIRQEGTRYHLDAVWNARLFGTRGCLQQRIQQVRRLVSSSARIRVGLV